MYESGLVLVQVWVISDTQSLLLASMHHAFTDGWTVGLLQRQLAEAYAALAAGSQPAWDPLPVQYRDVAAWQRTHLQGAVLDEQLAWWRETLAGAPPLLALPWEHARPAVASHAGVAAPVQLDVSAAAGLRQLAAAEQTPLFVVLLAAVQATLARLSGQDDVVVGTPYANRAQEEVQQLAGCLVNTLALRTDVGGDPSFQQLLQSAKATATEAFQRADAPFASVVSALKLDRSAAYNPVYQVPYAARVSASPEYLHVQRLSGRTC